MIRIESVRRSLALPVVLVGAVSLGACTSSPDRATTGSATTAVAPAEQTNKGYKSFELTVASRADVPAMSPDCAKEWAWRAVNPETDLTGVTLPVLAKTESISQVCGGGAGATHYQLGTTVAGCSLEVTFAGQTPDLGFRGWVTGQQFTTPDQAAALCSGPDKIPS